jgi:hypothetical protein
MPEIIDADGNLWVFDPDGRLPWFCEKYDEHARNSKVVAELGGPGAYLD